MKHRSEYRIVFDMLKVLEKMDMPVRLRLLYKRAKVGSDQQFEYTQTLNDCRFALLSGFSPRKDTAVITQRGLQFLAEYRTIMRLMGERE